MSSRWLWILLVVVVVAALWLWSALRPQATLQVTRAQRRDLQAFVEERAVTELPHDTLISMPISGWLQRIDLREGDAVQAGQVLSRLEPDDLQDRVRQGEQRIAVLETQIAETQDNRLEGHMLVEARAVVKAIDETVRAAEVQLEGSLAIHEFAKSEIERLKRLSEAGSAAERELSQARTEYRKSGADYRSDVLELAALKTLAAVSYIGPKFITDYIDRKSFKLESYRRQLEEAAAQLEIEKRNLQRAVITSPIDGIVLQRHQTRRQYLPAGTPLLTLGRLEDMEVIAEVLTERATRIEPGGAVEVHGEALPQGSVPGRVLRVYPAGFETVSSLGVEQQRVNVAIKLNDIPERLGVGYRVHVRIIVDQAGNVPALPRTCLFRSPQGEWRVLVVRNDRVEQRALTVGLMNDEWIEIRDGLSSEDWVVRHPSRDIVPGLRVRTVTATP